MSSERMRQVDPTLDAFSFPSAMIPRKVLSETCSSSQAMAKVRMRGRSPTVPPSGGGTCKRQERRGHVADAVGLVELRLRPLAHR